MKTKDEPPSSKSSRERSWPLTSPSPDSSPRTTPASALGLIPTGSGTLFLPIPLPAQSVASLSPPNPSGERSSYNFAGTLTPENIEEAFDDIIELDLNQIERWAG